MKDSWRAYYRKRTKDELTSILTRLGVHCQEPDPTAKGAADLLKAIKQFTFWPTKELLQQLDHCVMCLVTSGGRFELIGRWKAFQRLNKRMPSLRLVLSVDNLVKRALNRLKESGRSALAELSWENGKNAQNLLRDIARVRENLSAAEIIDWAQHELVLSRFSRASTVELACGKNTASQEVRCYARALELIVDHDKREPLRREAEALVGWLLEIRHPIAKELRAFYHEAAFADKDKSTHLADLIKTRRKREAKRERDRRYRAGKNSLPEKRRAVTR